MDKIKRELENWRRNLCPKVEASALYARNPAAHKWKAPFRSMVLRELLFWRIHDLLTQVVVLAEKNHGIGARILLRSVVETLALLIFLNQKTESLLNGSLDFDSFSSATSRLLLGGRDDITPLEAINIITVLEKCDKKLPTN